MFLGEKLIGKTLKLELSVVTKGDVGSGMIAEFFVDIVVEAEGETCP